MGPLYVVAAVSNPVRYKSRYILFNEFAARMDANPDVVLIRVELAMGEREFSCTEADNPHHVRVRAGAESEVWVKESLLNIGIRKLTELYDWSYVAWIDGDVEFARPQWAMEAMEALQHWKVVQPWSRCMDMGPHYVPMGQSRSFCHDYYAWQADSAMCGVFDPKVFLSNTYCGKAVNGVNTFHPGFAWAIRRDAWEKIGPLIDWVPLGSADHHMAWAFAGRLTEAVKHHTPGYLRRIHAFQAKCDKYLQGDIGYADGTILHHWHGQKKNRYYIARETTLDAVNFDPDTDVAFNHQGLLVLTGHNLALRDAVRHYFRARHEDSIDME